MITKRGWMMIVIDLIVLMELTASIGIASRFNDSMTAVFLYVYIPTALVTIIISKICLNRFCPVDPAEAEKIQPVFPLS
ncbi:MAG: hypothetical protein AB1724_15445 [Thermodesulfobacteriota bacterium]